MESGESPCVRILWIEDCPCDAELVNQKLKGADIPYSITRVFSWERFEEEWGKHQFHVVISDSAVPGMDTLEALAKVRASRPEIPFIMLTGNHSPVLRETALGQGASEYIDKQQLPQLIRVLRNLWEKIPKQTSGSLPPPRKWVMVQTKHFRCLGYLDPDGKWKDCFDSKELPDVTGWSDL